MVRKALLIGINYIGTEYELNGCINDAKNLRSFLTDNCLFKNENIKMLSDEDSLNLPNNIKEQIRYLNQLVVDWSVETIIPEVYQYYGYLKEIEFMPIPIDLPLNLSSKGSRSLRSVTTTF